MRFCPSLRALGCSLFAACALLTTPPALAQHGADAPAGPRAEFERAWHIFGDKPPYWAKLQQLVGTPAPELDVQRWIGDERTLADLRGKIVLLDFWGTWCAPCLRGMPHTNSVYKQYRDRGVEIIGVCDGMKRAERFDSTVERLGVSFPMALDNVRSTYKRFNGQWFPFLVLVDRQGVIRACGLDPAHLEKALDALLAEQPAAPAPGPEDWLEGSEPVRERLEGLTGAAAPEMSAVRWITGASSADDAAATLVMFWGPWSAKSVEALERVAELHSTLGGEGLRVVALCHPKGSDEAVEIAEDLGLAFEVGVDEGAELFEAYRVDGAPDYYVLDREGRVVLADVSEAGVEPAVRHVLAGGR